MGETAAVATVCCNKVLHRRVLMHPFALRLNLTTTDPHGVCVCARQGEGEHERACCAWRAAHPLRALVPLHFSIQSLARPPSLGSLSLQARARAGWRAPNDAIPPCVQSGARGGRISWSAINPDRYVMCAMTFAKRATFTLQHLMSKVMSLRPSGGGLGCSNNYHFCMPASNLSQFTPVACQAGLRSLLFVSTLYFAASKPPV